MSELTAASAADQTAPRRGAKLARRTGTMLLLVGVLLLLWGGWTWLWGDPVTRVYQAWEQHRLADEHGEQMRAYESGWVRVVPTPARTRPRPSRPALAGPAITAQLVREAKRYRASLAPGDSVARLRVPRLSLDEIVVEGTKASDLRRGPGRDRRTFMPGEGELSYIAGHRTTFGAPFAHIDRLRPGDLATIEMPYATLTYRVTGSRIVAADELSVLDTRGRDELAFQACHPRFFASQRYLVYASLELIRLPDTAGGATYRFTSTKRRAAA